MTSYLSFPSSSSNHRENEILLYSWYHLFKSLGDDWVLENEVMQDLEKFTCIMYGQARESSVNVVRVKMLKKMVGEDETISKKSKIDLARIPPCQDSLIPHCQRANHRLACHKRANQPIIEKPKPYDMDQGWQKVENGSYHWNPYGPEDQFYPCH